MLGPISSDSLWGEDLSWNERLPVSETSMSSDHTSIVSDEQLRSHKDCVRRSDHTPHWTDVVRTQICTSSIKETGGWSQQTYAQNQRGCNREGETDKGINGIIDVQPKPRDAAAKFQTKSQETENSLVTAQRALLYSTQTPSFHIHRDWHKALKLRV